DKFLVLYAGYYNDHLTTHVWTDGDLTGDGKVNFFDLTQILSDWNDPGPPTAHTITANSNYMVDDGYVNDGINLAAGSHNFELDYFQRNDLNSYAQLQFYGSGSDTSLH